MMNRMLDWETKLADFIHANLRTPFAWGKFDCCLFACDAVQAVTGTDLARDFRGKYDSLASAYAMAKEYSGGAIAELAEKKAAEYELAEVPLAFASRGDVVLVSTVLGDALGIIGMDGIDALCSASHGLVKVSRSAWKKAWRI
jgi:hypothetical protein